VRAAPPRTRAVPIQTRSAPQRTAGIPPEALRLGSISAGLISVHKSLLDGRVFQWTGDGQPVESRRRTLASCDRLQDPSDHRQCRVPQLRRSLAAASAESTRSVQRELSKNRPRSTMEDRSLVPFITGADRGSFAVEGSSTSCRRPSDCSGPRGESSRVRLAPKRIGLARYVPARHGPPEDRVRGGPARSLTRKVAVADAAPFIQNHRTVTGRTRCGVPASSRCGSRPDSRFGPLNPRRRRRSLVRGCFCGAHCSSYPGPLSWPFWCSS